MGDTLSFTKQDKSFFFSGFNWTPNSWAASYTWWFLVAGFSLLSAYLLAFGPSFFVAIELIII
jgi:hypothetical protein